MLIFGKGFEVPSNPMYPDRTLISSFLQVSICIMKLLVFFADTGNRDFIMIWCVLCKFMQLFPKRHDPVSQLVADSVPSITASALYAAQVSSAFHLGSDELVSQPDALTVWAIEGGLQFC